MSNKVKIVSYDGNYNDSEIKILIDSELLLIDNENGTVTGISQTINSSTYRYNVMITYVVA